MLKEQNSDGMYLIRGGTHAGAEKVLSVWHVDKCRHYRLFKDEVQQKHSQTTQYSSALIICSQKPGRKGLTTVAVIAGLT